MSVQSHRLARLFEIITLVQSNNGWGPQQLARHFGISDTRIYQDVKELSLAGVPISFTGKGYEIDETFFLPSLNLTADEILLLLLPDFPVQQHSGAVAERVRAKLLSCLPARLRRLITDALDRTHVLPDTEPEPDESFHLIHKAVAEQMRVVIDYHSLSAPDYERRAIDPLGLVYRGHAWYIIALCHKHKEIRTFRLSRTRSVLLTDIHFRRPEGFSLRTWLAGRWGIFGGEEREVIIRFSPVAARLVEDKPPVKNGTLLKLSDGSAIFRARVKGVQEIAWWVMKYGDQAEVIRPECLRQQVIDTVRRMAGLYRMPLAEPVAAEAEEDYRRHTEE